MKGETMRRVKKHDVLGVNGRLWRVLCVQDGTVTAVPLATEVFECYVVGPDAGISIVPGTPVPVKIVGVERGQS